MASVFVRFRVADFDTWKRTFDENQRMRAAAGFKNHSVHRDADDPNVVVIAFRAEDLARAREFASSPELRAVQQRAGVEGPPEFWYTEDVEEKSY